VVRQSGIEIICHAIDLGQPPDQLIEHLHRVAEAIVSECA
jgi:hypothetical protein